ncbi:MAG: CBS domain-containing protein [Acidobacteriota bacterium]|nr:CBS domain-containing protein [Acidobacteriota bacterium]
MTLGEICTRRAIIAPRETLVGDIARLMRERHTGDVVITETHEGRRVPVGIVTDRDLVMEVLAQNCSPAELSAADIMDGTLVSGKESDGIFETIQLMRSARVRRLPVVDATGALVGVVSLDDLLELLAEELGDLVTLIRQERRKEVETRH